MNIQVILQSCPADGNFKQESPVDGLAKKYHYLNYSVTIDKNLYAMILQMWAYTGPGTTWTNEKNLGMSQSAGSTAWLANLGSRVLALGYVFQHLVQEEILVWMENTLILKHMYFTELIQSLQYYVSLLFSTVAKCTMICFNVNIYLFQ